jgi:hypothetical protein
MHQRSLPPHLPKPPSDPVTYQQLHDLSWWLRTGGEVRQEARRPAADSTHAVSSSAFATRNRPATTSDDVDLCLFDTEPASDAWREIRIPTGLSAAEVYRKLPSATDGEYGGYLTKTRIRYVSGDATGVYVPFEKSCTFHSHPSGDPAADAPSSLDIYAFLKWEHQRTITVGSDWIWVWTKNPQSLKMVWRLWKWELQNLAPALMASCRSHGKHMVTHYAGQALQDLGLRWPCRQSLDPKRWMPLLRETLGIRTRLIRRRAVMHA